MTSKPIYVDINDFLDGKFQPESPPDVMIVTAPPVTNSESPFIEWWGDGYVDETRPRPVKPYNGSGKVISPKNTSLGEGTYEANYEGHVYDIEVDKNGRATVVKFKKEVAYAKKNISKDEIEKNVKEIAETAFRKSYSLREMSKKYPLPDNTRKLIDSFTNEYLNGTKSQVSKEKGYYVRDTAFVNMPGGLSFGITNKVESEIENNLRDSLGILNKIKDDLITKNNEYYLKGIKLCEFIGIKPNAFEVSELDMLNTLPAEPFLEGNYDGIKLSKLADKGVTIEVNNRVALIKDVNGNKSTAYLINADGVAVSKNIPIIKATYVKESTVFHYELADEKISVGRVFLQNPNDMGFSHLIKDKTIKTKNLVLPEKIQLNNKLQLEDIQLPYEYQVNDAIIVFPDGSNMNPIYVYYGYPKSQYVDELKNNERKKQEAEYDQLKTGIKATLDFYKEVTEQLGLKAEILAENLAASSKGKRIRNAEDALKAFEKYKNSLGKKYGVKDREVIAKALEARDTKLAAERLNKMSKVFFKAGKVMDYADLGNELVKAIKTDNWRPFFVKAETLIAGSMAGAATAFAFSIVLGGPVGIIGFALIMAAVGALVDEQFVENINKTLGI